MKFFLILLLIISIYIPVNADDSKGEDSAKEDMSFYDKGVLNEPIMQFESDALKTQLEQHVYQVREGSIGGYDSSGGSCGCN